MQHSRVDVAIVGGGPAGLAAAICLRERGHAVTVLDRRRPPIDKACGEGLMPPALHWLRRHAVQLPEGAGHTFVGIRYVDGSRIVEGRYRSGHGLGLRRTILHAALSDRASQLGAHLYWGVDALALSTERLHSSVGSIGAQWVIGADGLHSQVRRWAGLDTPAVPGQRFGRRRHYQITPWTDHVEVHWADAMEAYVTPVSDREIGVAILGAAVAGDFDALLDRFSALRERLGEAAVVSSPRGAGPLRQRARAVGRDKVLLIGDAAGYVDAITGEGIALAFAQADAMAAALGAPSVDLDLRQQAAVRRRYARACHCIVRRPDRLTRMVLLLAEHPGLRHAVLGVLRRSPWLFDRALALTNPGHSS
jgi:flavin-dependent dehydrogenase